MTDSIGHTKKAMIEALEKSLGVVTTACKQVGISRDTHYRWMKEDEEYKDKVVAVADVAVDFAESQLFQQIKNGNTTATIFFLKTRAKERGYVEKSEIDHTTGGEKINKVQIEIIGTDSKDTGQSDTTEDS